MTNLHDLQEKLDDFWQLPHHHDTTLAEILREVQHWQRQRILQTHQDLLSNPKYQAMGEFLINQLYGGEQLYPVIKQLQLVLKKSAKIEKFIPESAMQTGIASVLEMVNAIELDLELVNYFFYQQKPINEQSMMDAYRAVNRQQERYQQILGLKETCYLAERELKSFLLQQAFRLAKPMAYKHDLQHLYDFIAEGLTAIQPIKQMSDFIEPFCAKENAIIDKVHTGNVTPFVV